MSTEPGEVQYSFSADRDFSPQDYYEKGIDEENEIEVDEYDSLMEDYADGGDTHR